MDGDVGIGNDTHMMLKRCYADNGNLLAKAREFLVDEICQYLDSVEESEHNTTNAEDDDIDPQYKFFLDNLREDGFLFLVEYSVVSDSDNGPSSCLTYEEDDGKRVESRKSGVAGNRRSLRIRSGLKRSRSGNLGNVPRDARTGQERSKKVELKAKRHGNGKNTDVKKESVVVDECYKAYLMRMGYIEEKPERFVEVKLEKMDTEASCYSDIIAIGDHPFSDDEYSPFVPLKKHNAIVDVEEEGHVEAVSSSSLFRKELMEMLRRPYDETEFVNLYREVSVRKNVVRERDLRDGRVIRYETDILGESYLDKHPEFRERLVPWDGSTEFEDFSVLPLKDRRRALSLLRAFVFYIQNVVHEDAFKPWLDTECLQTITSMSHL